MKLKAIIADDEQSARIALRYLVEAYCPEVEILSEAKDVNQLKIEIEIHNPQLVFLDMSMNGTLGFQIFDLVKKTFEVVVTSAYSEYALQSFDYGIVDYLIKPISPSGLKRAISRVNNIFHSPEEQKFSLFTSNGIIRITVKNIIRVESDRNYSWFFLENGEPILSSRNLGHFENTLGQYGFVRIHQSHLVPESRIELFNRSENYVLLNDGTRLPISREKRKNLKGHY